MELRALLGRPFTAPTLNPSLIGVIHSTQRGVPKPPCKPTIEVKVTDAVVEEEYPDGVVGVLTSPSYLQAQEYTRSFSWELKLLGVPGSIVTKLRKSEIPYRPPVKLEVLSPTYYEVLKVAEESKLRSLVGSYFTNTLLMFEKTVESIEEGGISGIFAGESTVRGRPIPIVRVLREHLVSKSRVVKLDGSEVTDEG